MDKLVVSLGVLLCFVGAHAATPPGCEPAAELDVSAAVVAREDLGSRERVEIDLKIFSISGRDEAVRIAGAKGAAGIPARVLSLAERGPRKARVTLELDKGAEHHLEFSVTSVSDPSRVSTAYVKVDLDPERRPEVLDGAIQYRARMQGR